MLFSGAWGPLLDSMGSTEEDASIASRRAASDGVARWAPAEVPAGSTETSASSVEPLAEVGVVSLVVSVETVGVDQKDAGAVAWAAAITADDANDALAVTVTGSAGVAIHWHAVVQGSEVVF